MLLILFFVISCRGAIQRLDQGSHPFRALNPEFCEFRRDGRYCDGPYVKYCIQGYNVMQYSCVSACSSGTCIGSAQECYADTRDTRKGSFCKGNQRFSCSEGIIIGYEYCPNGCSDGKCVGAEFTGCKNKARGCECDSEGNVNCCSHVLMQQFRCAGDCTNGTCQLKSDSNASNASNLSSRISVLALVFVIIASIM